MKVGLLLPNSNYLNILARNLKGAINFALKQNNVDDIDFAIEVSGFNAEAKVVEEKLQLLIIKDQVDVIIAPLNSGMIENIKHVPISNQIPLIALTYGEDPCFSVSLNEYVFVNSLNLWKSSWLLGYWSAANIGTKGCTMTAIHDAGYNISFAFAVGVEAANGILLQTAITHQESISENPTNKIEEILNQNSDFIYALYSGKEANSFFRYYDELDKKNTPVITSSSVFETDQSPGISESMIGLKSVTTIPSSLDSIANLNKAYTSATGNRKMNGYDIMAYEAILFLIEAKKENINNSQGLIDILSTLSISGPRGPICFGENHEVDTPQYLQQLESVNPISNAIVEIINEPSVLTTQYELAKKNLVKQGWLNPYLIA
jgi:ABC-type branched-subunit amino acid transport system substrate-binding protein